MFAVKLPLKILLKKLSKQQHNLRSTNVAIMHITKMYQSLKILTVSWVMVMLSSLQLPY